MQNDLKPHILDHVNMYLDCAFSPEGALLVVTGTAAASYTGVREETDKYSYVSVWDVQTGRQQANWKAGPINKAIFAPLGMTLATAHDNRICLRDAVTGQVQKTFLENLSAKYSPGFWTLAFSSDGGSLAVGLENSEDIANAYSVSLGAETSIMPLQAANDEETIPRRSVAQCRFLPGNRLLAGTGYTYDDEDYVYLWDLAIGKKLLTFGSESAEFEGETGQPIILSPDGTFLVLAPEPGDAARKASVRRLTEREGIYSWQEQCTVGGDQYATRRGTFSPDGRLFATPKMKGGDLTGDVPASSTVTHWEMPSGKERVSFTVPGRCYCWAVSPDGKTFAALSGIPEKHHWGDAPKYLLHLWNTETGQERAVMRTEIRKTNQLFHEPRSAVFSPDGNFLAVSHLCHAELWNLTSILDA